MIRAGTTYYNFAGTFKEYQFVTAMLNVTARIIPAIELADSLQLLWAYALSISITTGATFSKLWWCC